MSTFSSPWWSAWSTISQFTFSTKEQSTKVHGPVVCRGRVVRSESEAPLISSSGLEEVPMREKMFAVRDTMIALGMQLVFRATILLRRWNY